MAQIDVLKAQIVRNDLSTPWGFRLQGGSEQGQPVTIMRVTPGSPANRIGVKSGDEVTHISNRCTKHMTLQQVHDLIAQHTQTLVLTLERRASGSVPTNPLLTPPPEAEPPVDPHLGYQTYDTPQAPAPAPNEYHTSAVSHPAPELSEADEVTIIRVMQPPRPLTPPTPPKFYQPFAFNRPTPSATAPVIPKKYVFQKVQSKPFTSPPSGPSRYQSPPAAAPATPPQDFTPPQYAPHSQYQEPGDASADPNVTQSRTFKHLQSMMHNEEPAAGVYGLPPPRSAYMERTKQEEAERKRQAGQQRVKVFMPQQYNSPISMYSARNVVDSFQTQAEGYFDQMESKQDPRHISPTSGVTDM